MIKSEYIIKTMNRNELDIAIEWAALEGWNPGLHDAECFHAADPRGFLIGRLDGEPIATISVVKYNDSFGFLGFYIVKPEYRGKGYGIQIWNAGLKYLEGCNIGLDGVVDQQGNYNKSGFQLAYRNMRYEDISGGQFPKTPDFINLSSVSFETIDSYDRDFFPTSRTQFLKCWLNESGSKSLGILQDGRLSGYGVIRACRNGYKVGPLFANSPQLANSLFIALKARKRGHPLKGLSREKTDLPPKKIYLFFACPLTFAPAQPRFIVTFFRTRYFFLVG
ncbi:MAG: GNAT family N-acetyltransferase [Desulfobacterales bacterium]